MVKLTTHVDRVAPASYFNFDDVVLHETQKIFSKNLGLEFSHKVADKNSRYFTQNVI